MDNQWTQKNLGINQIPSWGESKWALYKGPLPETPRWTTRRAYWKNRIRVYLDEKE